MTVETASAMAPSADDARTLTDRIKVAVEGTWLLIQEAYTSRAWAALDYATWDDYCAEEFGTSRLRLPREERQEVVASLRESGLSTRAIASATGMNQSTIARDLRGDANASPAVQGTDGKTYSAHLLPPAVRQVAALLLYRAGYGSDWITERLSNAEMPSSTSSVTSALVDAAAAHLQAIGITYYGVGEAVAKLRGELVSPREPAPELAPEPDLLSGDDWVQPTEPTPEAMATPSRAPARSEFDGWSDEERALHRQLASGETVVVSMRRHQNLIAWASTAYLYERIDRRSPWGNPFELPGDGDRGTVIANYEQHYLPYKPSLLDRLHELKGKALGCWCAPDACHGDVLKDGADEL
ncbi:DUF4326 domain-containing protein [Streptomyces sp. NPDC051320]|uniref:DUF4326 domain-containing protein n=1 Tax=Streptomyces sp. NPDC051320 TaxID=3154644 RepID=UPI0034132BCE